MARRPRSSGDHNEYVVLHGRKITLKEHPTDFSVLAPKETVEKDPNDYQAVAGLGGGLSRARASDPQNRDALMDEVRKRNVAHHVYVVEDTGEEIVINDRIILTLRHEGTGALERIMAEHHLDYVRKIGNAHVLRVTDETGRNPLRTANMLADLDEVESCEPDILQQIDYHQAPALFPRQWYLTTDLISHPAVHPNASAEVPEAWTVTKGHRDIVVAVIDDGIDTGHPAFSGTRFHSDGATFVRGDVGVDPEAGDFHGTPVASIAVGSHAGGAMYGIAPDCTFLPVQIPFGANESFVSNITILEVFEYVSTRADIVNCSFGYKPRSFPVLPAPFRAELAEIARSGGRRGNGLVMVFSAGNDDAPTFLEADENRNGVRYLTRNRFTGDFEVGEVPANRQVYTAYPMVPGVIVVGAMSSRTRKSGYSNWGPHVTVTAPSSNGHELRHMHADFAGQQPGLGQIAASNRPGIGTASSALFDDPTTSINERHYTASFGGTSGAAPVVAGIAALVLSANPTLTAAQVRQVLEASADQNLDAELDLAGDPNVQGLNGGFVSGRSLFFGRGKVNARAAVNRARALPGAIVATGVRHGSASPSLPIPDNLPQGVASRIEIPGPGPVRAIRAEVDITHTYRGDLRVSLISPEGLVASLHDMEGRWRDDLKTTFTAASHPDLAAFVTGGIEGGGTWTLHVSDNLRRDTGVLNSWSIDLREG